YTDLTACLAKTAVDAVHVCTPLPSHARLVEESLRAGRHVLVEKPLASTLSETRNLLDLAARAGVTLPPVHHFSLQHRIVRVKGELARLGEIGRVTYHTCSAGGDGRDAAGRRRVLREIVPHPISLFRALRGPGHGPIGWTVLDETADDLSF